MNPLGSVRDAVHAMLACGRRGAASPYDLSDARPAAPCRAVFIGQEKTLTLDLEPPLDPQRLRFAPRALEALQCLDEAGYALVVVTNQPGLAAGRFTRAEFARLQRAIATRIAQEAGVRLAGFYTCPHAPAAGPATACLCRKPAPGMLRQAARSQRFDLQRSWMVGEVLDDIEAGQRRLPCRAPRRRHGDRLAHVALAPARAPDPRPARRRTVDRRQRGPPAGTVRRARRGSAAVTS